MRWPKSQVPSRPPLTGVPWELFNPHGCLVWAESGQWERDRKTGHARGAVFPTMRASAADLALPSAFMGDGDPSELGWCAITRPQRKTHLASSRLSAKTNRKARNLRMMVVEWV